MTDDVNVVIPEDDDNEMGVDYKLEWVGHPYTKHVLKTAEALLEKSAQALDYACNQSTDSNVRGAYMAHLQIKMTINLLRGG